MSGEHQKSQVEQLENYRKKLFFGNQTGKFTTC